MTLLRSRFPIALLLAQAASIVASALFFRNVWPGPFTICGPVDWVEPWTPNLIWLLPLVVYVEGSRHLTCKLRQWRVLALIAVTANVALLAAYNWSLALLQSWEEARFWRWVEKCRASGAAICPAGLPIIDPPQPPTHWEWAAYAFTGALICIYVVLYRQLGRTAKPSSEDC